MKVPKLKADGYYFDRDEIIPGVPNRQPENQMTIVDATEQAEALTDDQAAEGLDGDLTPEGAFEEAYGLSGSDGGQAA